MRNSHQQGLTVIEILVAVGILGLLLALAWLPFSRYRARNAVHNAVDVLHAITDRAIETAKASGHPLPTALTRDGLASPANLGQPGQELWARIRQRHQVDAVPEVVAKRLLAHYSGVGFSSQGVGILDLDSDGSLRGVFLEILTRQAGSEVVLAVIPVDVNGEFALLGPAPVGALNFSTADYGQGLTLNRAGAVSSP